MKKHLQIMILLLLAAFLTACGMNNDEQPNGQTDDTAERVEDQTENGEDAFPVTLTDGLGDEITIAEQPERMISLMPSNTEILFALELGDEVVGVLDYDNYPEEVTEKEKVGDMEFNVEKVISLNPDIVFAHASHVVEEGFEQIRDADIDVVVINDANSFSETYESIKMLAQATGAVEKGEQIIEQMAADLEQIEAKASDVKEVDEVTVWVEVDPDLYTTGKNTFMHEMLDIINAKNAAQDEEGWVQFTEEDAVTLNPDVIVTTYGDYVENAEEIVLAREAWQDVAAVKAERVYDVHPDLVSRPGPRLVEGIEELAKVIYPEIFAQ